MPHLPESVIFAVAGIGSEEPALRSLARELGVEDRVRFLGHVEQEELPAALSACDIFIRPSRSEGMGISFIEAMAAGLPVIATPVGGIPDFLTAGETGWTVGVDAPEEIARAVKDILARPEEAKRITGNAKRLVAERYDWDRVAAEMRALFKELGI
jgi:glycosyltransferase involved in cell wall biosynthesis